ncbi:MAG TPA: DUF4397 domain-containing protein [Candidatus Angelobacter sp.]|nr:DUF4397 domain-containing protein [Candidatus Angelobacter sp.]
MRKLNRLVGLLAGTAMVAALAVPVAADSHDNAMVRVVHASPDAPNVDIWVDGETVLTDVPFTAVSDYLSLPAGTYSIAVSATGDTDPVIGPLDLDFEAGTAYTIAAYGFVAEINATVFTDDTTIADGQSKLRAIHLSPSAPADVDIALQGGDVVVPGLSFPEASGYLTLDAGDYPLEIRAAGEADAAFEFTASLPANTNVTAFAMDDGEGVQIVTAIDAEGTAMSPDTAMAQPSTVTPVLLAGLALLGMAALLTVRTLAARTER